MHIIQSNDITNYFKGVLYPQSGPKLTLKLYVLVHLFAVYQKCGTIITNYIL